MERQEVVFTDPVSRDRHIADVYTKNVVLEFQSYAIHPDEMKAREDFYQKMIWIVNGQKNPIDKNYFGLSLLGIDSNNPDLFIIKWVNPCFQSLYYV